MTTPGPADYLALRAVAERYATGVDRRDPVLFRSAFHPDARLRVYNPSETDKPAVMRGHDEIVVVIDRMGRYERTYHFLGNATYDVDGDRANGEVYCAAHHLERSEGTESTFVMYIRYRDAYRRDGDHAWRLERRDVLVDWTERRPAGPDTT